MAHTRLTTCAWFPRPGCSTSRCACRSSSHRRAGTPRHRRPRPRQPNGASASRLVHSAIAKSSAPAATIPHSPPRNRASRIGRWPKRPLIGSSGGAAPSWKRTKLMASTAMPSPRAPTKMPAGLKRGDGGGVGGVDVALEEGSVTPQVDRGEEQQGAEPGRGLAEGDVGVLEPLASVGPGHRGVQPQPQQHQARDSEEPGPAFAVDALVADQVSQEGCKPEESRAGRDGYQLVVDDHAFHFLLSADEASSARVDVSWSFVTPRADARGVSSVPFA